MANETYKLVWDATGDHIYETGLKMGVLYPINSEGVYTPGVAWNGLSSVSESPSGAEANAIYADDIKYLNLYSVEEFGATIEAYTYPDEWAECDGSANLSTGVILGQQDRKTFGLCYRTVIGNDVDGDAYGYKLHLIYGCKASPSERQYQTINDSPEAITFSWEISTIPVNVSGHKPVSCITIDSTKADPTKLANLERVLYGTNGSDAVAAVYEAVPDTAAFDNTKTYYTRSGAGTTESPYSYTEATGITEFASNTDYFTLKTPAQDAVAAVDPKLPTPDEIAEIFA